MESNFSYIDENLKEIRYNIADAVEKYRNNSDTVKLMAVTKTVAPEAVNHAVNLGLSLLGENRVQEFQSKKDFYDKTAEVQFIGHLQTNKVKYIINDVSMIQSVDSIRLAAEINRLAEANGKIMDILCEVNIGGEDSKSGVNPDGVYDTLCEIAELKNVCVHGLMTIPPPTDSDIFLAKMQELFHNMKGRKIEGINMDILSMGMTYDYAAAVKYGSTLVRIGTGLFGARVYK